MIASILRIILLSLTFGSAAFAGDEKSSGGGDTRMVEVRYQVHQALLRIEKLDPELGKTISTIDEKAQLILLAHFSLLEPTDPDVTLPFLARKDKGSEIRIYVDVSAVDAQPVARLTEVYLAEILRVAGIIHPQGNIGQSLIAAGLVAKFENWINTLRPIPTPGSTVRIEQFIAAQLLSKDLNKETIESMKELGLIIKPSLTIDEPADAKRLIEKGRMERTIYLINSKNFKAARDVLDKLINDEESGR